MLAFAVALAAYSAIGRSWHYLRTGLDGREAEHVWVHRAARDRLEVYKMRERCTGAAFVTATIDPATGQASELVAGRLLPEARVRSFGTIRYDPQRRRISLSIDGERRERVLTATATPWHLYDYDLATPAMATRVRWPIGRRFSFGLALVWPEDAGLRFDWLGPATARMAGRATRAGRPAISYAVSGLAFGAAGGGPLWRDARDGTLIEATWGRANHPGYRGNRLRLIGQEEGAARWQRRLRAHFAGCAAPSAKD